MSLPVLAVMVVFGIAAIVMAVHLTGGSRLARLADEAHARRRFAEDYPDEEVADVVLANDGAAAFLVLLGGRLGVVQAIGGHFLTRIVLPGDIAVLKMESSGLTLRSRDFTWKGGAFEFGEAAAAARIGAALQSASKIGAS